MTPLAYIALFAWPFVVIVMFMRLSLEKALAYSFVVGYLVLPLAPSFDFPVIPPINKDFILVISAGVMCLLTAAKMKTRKKALSRSRGIQAENQVPEFHIQRGQIFFYSALLLLFTSPFLTAMQNNDTFVIGGRVFRSLSTYDAFSINSTLLMLFLPFFLGRRFLATEEAHRILLKAIVIVALFYTLLALYEIRMSPQLNRTIYGFFPHSFAQHVRDGGFRPLVFLNHGLILAIFFAVATLASLALYRCASTTQYRLRWLLFAIWIFGVLFLSKSLGAFMLTLMFGPVLLFLRGWAQLLFAAIVSALVFSYPILRSNELVPVDRIHAFVETIDPARARSLNVRLQNEDRLLEKAMERPLAGWGTYGRNRVYSDWGKDISLTDGYWILTIGQYGWLGFIAQFGLLSFPVIMLAARRKKLDIPLVSSALVLIYTMNLLDLLPNASIGPLFMLMSGAVMGLYQTAPRKETKRAPERAKTPLPTSQEGRGRVSADQLGLGEAAKLHHRRPRVRG
ncbi:O-antigen ligase family protein [Roseovarius aestuariivivens]|uniref:O-antigen ligase family protein n=1 Tax=Roseovarius aestuariivivens TaxID=1888910 RepID=UPI001081D8FA|nr:hypothetical protein [Roseovarius aestuariivivens]